jgi:predicted MFS family arabinose efflux permease
LQAANANSSTINAIATSLIASMLYGAAVYVGERFYSRTAYKNPSYRRLRLVAFVLLWILLNVFLFTLASVWWLVLLITSIVLAVVIFKELNQFWQIGLVGADREVKSGIDYVAALGMCKH